MIEQVLLNILENAVYHAKDMTELNLKVEIKEKKAVFSVSDNGCGISPDIKDKIFNGYVSHSEAPMDGSRNNMGIGLSVCSTIVHAHGGTIHAENREEGGAIFYFMLEAEESDE